jgi:hypothetical protein
MVEYVKFINKKCAIYHHLSMYKNDPENNVTYASQFTACLLWFLPKGFEAKAKMYVLCCAECFGTRRCIPLGDN